MHYLRGFLYRIPQSCYLVDFSRFVVSFLRWNFFRLKREKEVGSGLGSSHSALDVSKHITHRGDSVQSPLFSSWPQNCGIFMTIDVQRCSPSFFFTSVRKDSWFWFQVEENCWTWVHGEHFSLLEGQAFQFWEKSENHEPKQSIFPTTEMRSPIEFLRRILAYRDSFSISKMKNSESQIFRITHWAGVKAHQDWERFEYI